MNTDINTAEIQAGANFGKYQIVRKIATGGMAEIYLARARGIVGFEKTVAIKRILGQYATQPSFVDLFLDEARLAANLQHPNIGQIYDVGKVDGCFFFAMEFIHGQDCRFLRHAAHKAGTRIPLGNVLTIVHGAAAGLGYAHEMCGVDGRSLGIVHRDISPANILLSYDGAVKVVDFGIAKAAERETQTRTGTMKGKIPYMAPEQCKGLVTDSRSDLFALGVVLYELSVGKRPFRGKNDFAVLQKIIKNECKRPSELVADYPPQLEAIVLRLLEPNPDKRYQRAEDVVIDLEVFAQEQGLRISTVELKLYMRHVFAEKIKAWEVARKEGASLEEHVARSISSASHTSAVMTPVTPAEPESLPLMPEEKPTTPRSQRPTRSPRYSSPPELDLAPKPTPLPAPASEYPRRRSTFAGGRVKVGVIGLALAGLVFAGLAFMKSSSSEEPAALSDHDAVPREAPPPLPEGIEEEVVNNEARPSAAEAMLAAEAESESVGEALAEASEAAVAAKAAQEARALAAAEAEAAATAEAAREASDAAKKQAAAKSAAEKKRRSLAAAAKRKQRLKAANTKPEPKPDPKSDPKPDPKPDPTPKPEGKETWNHNSALLPN